MKNFYKCKNAIVILGSTSIKKYLSVLRNINKEENVIFAETKCISKKLYENQVGDWIKRTLSGKGYSIEPKAAAMLVEFLGTDLSKINNELDKLLSLGQ